MIETPDAHWTAVKEILILTTGRRVGCGLRVTNTEKGSLTKNDPKKYFLVCLWKMGKI